MSWFGPKLEPGERVLLRDPVLRDLWGAILLATNVMAFMTLFLLSDRVQEDPPSALSGIWLFLGASFGLTVGVMILLRAVQDRWAITDRRVLAWRGVPRREVEELRRDEIDRSNLNGDDLMVRGGGRALRLNLKRVRDDAIKAALGDLAPPAGLKAEALKRIIGEGETLAWRHSPLWMRVLPAAAAWTAAVTDRRILLRRLHDFTRYDAIPLETIEEIEAPHEGSHRIYLHANGQRHEFRPGNQAAAERMYEAIQTAMKGMAR